MPPDVPPVFVRWESFLGWLLDETEKFPKSIRFTLTGRIENLAIDVFERFVDVRYGHDRAAVLHRINLDLEKLRLLLRLVHARRHLADRAFAHACEEIDTTGRMVGGWLRHERSTRRPPSSAAEPGR